MKAVPKARMIEHEDIFISWPGGHLIIEFPRLTQMNGVLSRVTHTLNLFVALFSYFAVLVFKTAITFETSIWKGIQAG